MRRRRHEEELVVRRLLDRLATEDAAPTEAELLRAARLAAAEGRSPQERPAARRPWRPFRLRWAAAVAAAMLLATGLGFGVATSLTPAGSATTDRVGLGFLPARGWTVVQSGAAGPAESARAIAANVPITPGDPAFGVSLPTLGSWPSWGIVVVASFRLRGDPLVDAAFPVRSLPLTFADATPATATEYVLRAAVGGYNVDANVTFGSEPTDDMLRAAEEQIARLVVSPAAITMSVRPTIYGRSGPMVVSGSVTSGKKNETVTVQFKQCGLLPEQFRDLFEVKTEDGGGWSAPTGVSANGVLRAVSGGETSNEVPVQKRVDIRLAPAPPGRYEVHVVEQASFWRKRVLVQRFDKRSRKWVLVKQLRLENQGAAPGSIFVWSTTDEFKVPVAKGTTIRAVLPLDQAKPCRIGGYSNLLVTK